MENFNPILMLDNEYENVSDLEEILEIAGRKAFPDAREITILAESAEETIRIMIDKKNSEESFSGLIFDNHLYGEMDGDDLLRIIHGKTGYCFKKNSVYTNLKPSKFKSFKEFANVATDNKHSSRSQMILDFLEEHFKGIKDYVSFVNYFSQERNEFPQIFLSGSTSRIDSTGLYGIYYVQKCQGCEYNVLDIIKNEGIFSPDVIIPAINNHYRLSPVIQQKKKEYNPSSKHIKTRKKILRGKRKK